MIYLDHLLNATHGVLLHAGKQSHFDAFSHDTRQLIPGELFVAVRGERSDGHDYLLDAVQRGASGLLVEAEYLNTLAEEAQKILAGARVATIVVEDTRIAWQQSGRLILARWHPRGFALPGSRGKSSTKEGIAAVLSSTFATFKSWQTYTDLLGLPLSLGRLEERHEYAVLELACDHPGEIRELCRIAQPSIGVLTNISPAQLQYFGTVERLAEELGTLLTSLPAAGLAVVNGDDQLDRALIAQLDNQLAAPIKTFAASMAKDVQVTWDGTRCTLPPGDEAVSPTHQHIDEIPRQDRRGLSEAKRSVYQYFVPSADLSAPTNLDSHLLGAHHVATMLAAYTVGRLCGLNAQEIARALANLYPLPGRLNPLQGIKGAMLLEDTHNATPASVTAGLETLRALPAGNRIAVLGDMLRLGSYEEEAHRRVGQKAAQCVNYLVTRGERAALIAESAHKAGLAMEHIILTSTHEDAAQAVRKIIALPGKHNHYTRLKDAVLIKGSEEMRMEHVSELLMARPAQAREQLVRQTPRWKQIVVIRPDGPTGADIDLFAIANNTRQVQSLVGPMVRILVSLKADAYGHGALKVARTVLHNGASMLGVATVSEAMPLREAGISAPILAFGYVPAWQMREAVRLGLTITLYSSESAQALSRAACTLGQAVKVHVKVDTGMGRLGIRAEQVTEVLELLHEIIDLPGLELEGIFTHFAMADTHDQTHARMQLARFHNVLPVVEKEHIRPSLVHAANSAAILSLPEAYFDMVRPGVALYGLDPSPEEIGRAHV